MYMSRLSIVANFFFEFEAGKDTRIGLTCPQPAKRILSFGWVRMNEEQSIS